ncbi:MAG: IPT/TIG domain-containing protein [Candidatus Sulfotelmatobacter sp.]
MSWNNNQVIATVNTGSSSGVAQIQQNGLSSNSIAFTVNTALISNVSPAGGLPGTQVTITGSGFGATQGSGMVWLGTAVGVVTNWSDGQVVATVAAGSTSGNALVLQNGVLSNTFPFTIDSLQIANIAPNSGSAGTVVTITGGGFGNSQGSGSVLIGGTTASVVGWSDAQVMASVPSNAVSGVLKVEQNQVWSNAVAFTVPPSSEGETQLTLVPTVISMVVGATQSIQAWNSSTQQLATGLTWTSSNTAVITLSTDDPPIITAVGAGTATITAGSASADVTVYPGTTLPTGTQIWSNSGDGSGVSKIMPAVPSSTGVADIFALQGDGYVWAIASDGTVGWTANVNSATSLTPDFQGGLVVANTNATPATVQELNGMTGVANPAYNFVAPNNPPVLVHTNGTIFTVDNNAIVGINPTTGEPQFTVPMEQSIGSANGDCGEYTPFQDSVAATVGQPIIAGDGYAYFPYVYTLQPLSSNQAICPSGGGTIHIETHSRLMRVGTDGSSLEIAVGDWAMDGQNIAYVGSLATGSLPGNVLGTLITNADQGVLYSWAACPSTLISNNCTAQFLLTTVADGSPSTVTANMGYQPGLSYEGIVPVQPILQRADGSYIGTAINPQLGNTMVAFTSSAQQLWSVPNDTPQIATADGGVIGASGTTYDQNGNVDGQISSLSPPSTQSNGGQWPSWTANTYALNSQSLASVAATPLSFAPDFAAVVGLNISGGGTAIKQSAAPQAGLLRLAGANLTALSKCNAFLGGLSSIAKTSEATLISQLQATATGARDYIYDGPSSNVRLDPVKFPGIATPNITTVGQWFNSGSSIPYYEGLSQYNGYAIFLRLDDWWSWVNGLSSQYIRGASGQVNFYGMGLVMHETLHKQAVAGGFTHEQMDTALTAAGAPTAPSENNPESFGIGSICFPDHP